MQRSLIKVACSYLQRDEIPLIIKSGENVWEFIPMSNNEETDKMLLLRAAMSNEATAIVVNATDVFLLLVYDSGQLEICSEPWYIKIDSN